MDGHTEIALCKICNTYVKYQDTDVYIDNDNLCIDCTQCMNQIKLKQKKLRHMKKFSNVQEIKLERENQRANDVIYTMLGVLLGEIDRLPTRDTPTEDQIYTIVNRMYNNAKEMSQYRVNSKIEMAYLQDYIKKQFTEAELTGIIIGLKEDGYNNIGDFMKALNALYKGRFDGKTASSIVNKVLKG